VIRTLKDIAAWGGAEDVQGVRGAVEDVQEPRELD
jgi:hypothetical protein